MKNKVVLFIDALMITLGKMVIRGFVLFVIVGVILKGVGVVEF